MALFALPLCTLVGAVDVHVSGFGHKPALRLGLKDVVEWLRAEP